MNNQNKLKNFLLLIIFLIIIYIVFNYFRVKYFLFQEPEQDIPPVPKKRVRFL